MIERYLEDLEKRIDPVVEEDLLGVWKEFTFGRSREPIFRPARRKKSLPGIEWPDVPVNDALADFDKMALQQLKGCSQVLADGTGRFMGGRSNYGTSIMPSLFGAELFVMDKALNVLPTSRPLAGGVDTFKRLVKRGAPDLRTGQGAQVLEMGARFVELMKPYPRVRRYVHVWHADMQGAIDICELLWGSGIFLDLIDVPDLVKDMLWLITETYILFMREWDRIVPSPHGCTVHWGMMHRGHIMLRQDSAMNLSPDMYAEFIAPYEGRLLRELGGGAIHFCGRGDHYIARACGLEGLYAITLSQPHLNDMEAIYRNTVDKGIKLIGLSVQAAETALKAGRDLHGHVHCL